MFRHARISSAASWNINCARESAIRRREYETYGTKWKRNRLDNVVYCKENDVRKACVSGVRRVFARKHYQVHVRHKSLPLYFLIIQIFLRVKIFQFSKSFDLELFSFLFFLLLTRQYSSDFRSLHWRKFVSFLKYFFSILSNFLLTAVKFRVKALNIVHDAGDL